MLVRLMYTTIFYLFGKNGQKEDEKSLSSFRDICRIFVSTLNSISNFQSGLSMKNTSREVLERLRAVHLLVTRLCSYCNIEASTIGSRLRLGSASSSASYSSRRAVSVLQNQYSKLNAAFSINYNDFGGRSDLLRFAAAAFHT
jgi:hypothetical protein